MTHSLILLATLLFTFGMISLSAQENHDHGTDPLATQASDCVVDYGEEVNPTIVLQMRKYVGSKENQTVLSSAAPTVTSVQGKTVVAVFYMHIDEGVNSPPLIWTPQLFQEVQANIRKNADWWEATATHYNKEAKLSIVEYGIESPITLLDYDPTATTTPGGFINDRSFYDTVMNRLGYTVGNSTEKMTAYCQDLAATNNADQAFIVWVITGKNTIRSNASFFGPSTNVWYNAARTGWTTAHEMGHIFGAFDEYYEEGTEYGRSRQSRNGAPNGNHYYRNYPQIPCMMSTSHDEGICSYTAVHVGLTNTVHLTAVRALDSNGTWQVRYRETNGEFGSIVDRYQGSVLFPWGAGMQVELRAFDSVGTTEFKMLSDPEWEGYAGDRIELQVDTGESQPINLIYRSTTSGTTYKMTYLSQERGGMGANVIDMVPIGSGRVAIASRDGICIYQHPERLVLDYPFRDSRDGSPRRGYSTAFSSDSTLLFGTQNSEIVRVASNGDLSSLVGPTTGQKYYAVAQTSEGDIWGGSDVGLHRFRNGNEAEVTTYSSGRDPVIGQTVWSLAVDNGGKLWIGSRGRRDQGGSGGGLQQFDPETDTWTDYTDQVDGGTITSISVWGDTIAVGTLNGFTLYNGETWERYLPGRDFNQNVMMVSRDAEGNLVLATFGGVYRQNKQGKWENYSKENSILPDNLCQSAALDSDGRTWIGTSEGTIVLMEFNTASSSVKNHVQSSGQQTLAVAPNPARSTTTVEIDFKTSADGTLLLFDEVGRIRREVYRGHFSSGSHSFTISLSDLEPGVYHLLLQTDRESNSTGIVIER